MGRDGEKRGLREQSAEKAERQPAWQGAGKAGTGQGEPRGMGSGDAQSEVGCWQMGAEVPWAGAAVQAVVENWGAMRPGRALSCR